MQLVIPPPSRLLDLDTRNPARPLLRLRRPRQKANGNAVIPTTMTQVDLRTVMPPQRSKVAMEVVAQVLGTTRSKI